MRFCKPSQWPSASYNTRCAFSGAYLSSVGEAVWRCLLKYPHIILNCFCMSAHHARFLQNAARNSRSSAGATAEAWPPSSSNFVDIQFLNSCSPGSVENVYTFSEKASFPVGWRGERWWLRVSIGFGDSRSAAVMRTSLSSCKVSAAGELTASPWLGECMHCLVQLCGCNRTGFCRSEKQMCICSQMTNWNTQQLGSISS